jgi:hypothetical protein
MVLTSNPSLLILDRKSEKHYKENAYWKLMEYLAIEEVVR